MMSKKDLEWLKENDPTAYYELMEDLTVEGSDFIITLIVALIVISILVYITQ